MRLASSPHEAAWHHPHRGSAAGWRPTWRVNAYLQAGSQRGESSGLMEPLFSLIMLFLLWHFNIQALMRLVWLSGPRALTEGRFIEVGWMNASARHVKETRVRTEPNGLLKDRQSIASQRWHHRHHSMNNADRSDGDKTAEGNRVEMYCV